MRGPTWEESPVLWAMGEGDLLREMSLLLRLDWLWESRSGKSSRMELPRSCSSAATPWGKFQYFSDCTGTSCLLDSRLV